MKTTFHRSVATGYTPVLRNDRFMNHIRKLVRFLAWFLALFSLGAVALAEPLPPIAVLEGKYQFEAVGFVGDCRVSLERPKNTLDLLHFRHECHQPLADKLALLNTMLEALLPDQKDRQAIRTLFVGRLVVTFPEVAQRVALAASQSPDWDHKRPSKESGYSNRFVFQLLKRQNLFPELLESLHLVGYESQVASVEKILMGKPKDLPFGSELLEQGVDPKTRIPFDAMTWFHLETLPSSGASGLSQGLSGPKQKGVLNKKN